MRLSSVVRARLRAGAISWAFAALVATSATSCLQGSSSSGATCPPDSRLTYDNFGRSFMQSYCNGCHGATFGSDASIQRNADLIDGAAAAGPGAVNTWMPPNRPVPLGQRQMLGEWLACGAP